MEAAHLLITLGLAILIFILISRRCTPQGRPPIVLPMIEIKDPVVVRRMIFDHADAFSTRQLSTFPVDFDAGKVRRSYSMTTAPHGPLWRAFRCNLTANIIHPSRLGRIRHLQQEAVETLVAGITARCGHSGEVVLVRDSLLDAMFPLIVRLCFGEGVDERHTRAMRSAVQEFVDEFPAARTLAASRLARLVHWKRWLRFTGTFDRMWVLFRPLIEARRLRGSKCCANSVHSYVDTLIELQVPTGGTGGANHRRGLRDIEISALVSEFLGAGTWTVVTCLEWTLAHLADKPGAQAKIYHEVVAVAGGDLVLSEERLRASPYLQAVMLESLRLHPPVPVIIRDAAGTEVAKACGVIGAAALSGCPLVTVAVSPGDIGRNPGAWTDPDEFVPERFLAGGEGEHVSPIPGPKDIKMMPFGAGRRACPGAGLAMLHVQMFLAALVREFEWEPSANDDMPRVDFTEVKGFFNTMKKPLSARFKRRKNNKYNN